MSASSIDKMTKTTIQYPSTVEGMIQRIKALRMLCTFFFGKGNFPSQGLRQFTNKCKAQTNVKSKNQCGSRIYSESHVLF
mmetsp:Transcript_20672/g.25446  ORF Transcript_20672/g.25446 Transcript_20672/m.25446 type:complete len:80 (-) Transcript_20672:122-361(-)